MEKFRLVAWVSGTALGATSLPSFGARGFFSHGAYVFWFTQSVLSPQSSKSKADSSLARTSLISCHSKF
ncbi:uncharacterized protein PG986_011131 [Apiospora aurea]|uniref:Secreted protein n=1 Tax=Apiospora aurea TaxID=335848 RepID=A0ABR1Q4D0_9PEZI